MSDQQGPPPPPAREREALLKAIAESVVRPDDELPGMGQMATHTFVLPTNVLSLGGNVIDDCVKKALEPSGLINWCSTIKRVHPVCTRGDGNCLLHAVSLYLWGVHDSQYVLRRLVSATLLRDRGPIKRRWQYQMQKESSSIPGGVHLSEEEWQKDWDSVVRLVCDSDSQQPLQCVNSLEAVHVFAIANVLRRPVLVYGEAVVRDVSGYSFSPNNMVGAYLPLLSEPAECTRSPVLLTFHNGHFVPLLSVDDAQSAGGSALAVSGLHAAPLVLRSLEQLRVHFLVASEERRVFDLLHAYFNLDEAPFTQRDSVQSILYARLSLRPLPASLRAAALPQPPSQVSWSAAAMVALPPCADDASSGGGGTDSCAQSSNAAVAAAVGQVAYGCLPLSSAFAMAPAAAAAAAPAAASSARNLAPAAAAAATAAVRRPAAEADAAGLAATAAAPAPPPQLASASSAAASPTAIRALPTAAPAAAAAAAPAATLPVVGCDLVTGGHSSSAERVAAPDGGAERLDSLPPDLAPLDGRGRQLSPDDLEALRLTSLSGAQCVTVGCPYYSSITTYPHCHDCDRRRRQQQQRSAVSAMGVPRVGAASVAAADTKVAASQQQRPTVSSDAATAAAWPAGQTKPTAAAAAGALTSTGARSYAAATRGGRQQLAGVICAQYNCQAVASTGSYPYCLQCGPSAAPAALRSPTATGSVNEERSAAAGRGPSGPALQPPAPSDCLRPASSSSQPPPVLRPAQGASDPVGRASSRPASDGSAPVPLVAASAGGLGPPGSPMSLSHAAGSFMATGEGPPPVRASADRGSSSNSDSRNGTLGREPLPQPQQQLPPGGSSSGSVSAAVTFARAEDGPERPGLGLGGPTKPAEPVSTVAATGYCVDELIRMPPPSQPHSKPGPLPAAEGAASGAGHGGTHADATSVAGPERAQAALTAGNSSECVHPECTNRGAAECGGLCKECYDIICAAKRKQRQKKTTADVALCTYSGCSGFGHADLDGLCQRHFPRSER